MPRTKDHSGIKTYVYKEFQVEELPYFLYEISINKYWKNGFCVLGHKFLKSSKLLDIKQNNIFKRYKDYIIEKGISILGVPYDFIRENNLSIYEKKNVKKCKK